MANVLFKRGHHANLPVSGTNAVIDGAFYLTDDTNRLYVGQGHNLVELNKSITTVATVNDLPAVTDVEVGQFYYIQGASNATPNSDGTNKNILAVVIDDPVSGKRWVQVNPDTNTDTGYDQIVQANSSVSAGTKTTHNGQDSLKYTITLGRAHTGSTTASNNTTLSDITLDFYIDGDQITSVISDTAVKTVSDAVSTSTVAHGATTIKTDGVGSDATAGVSVQGGTNVTLTGNANEIVINAVDTKYDLVSTQNSNSIILKEGSQNKATVNFAAGTALSVSEATAGTITYGHADVAASTSNDDSNKHSTATAQNGTDGAQITVVESVVVNAQGHVTNVATKTVTAKDTKVSSASLSVSGKNISGTIVPTTGSNISMTGGDGALWHKLTIDGTETEVANQGTLSTSLASTDALNAAIRGLNAMTYKGTVGTNGTVATLPVPNNTPGSEVYVQLGDTYVVKTAGAGDVSTSKPGDMYIAQGTEDSNGNIEANALTWAYVPAGLDADTRYQFRVDSNNLQYKEGDGSYQTFATISGDGNVISTSTSGTTVTITHGNSGVTAAADVGSNSTLPTSTADVTLAASNKFNIPVISVNAQGHVTALSNQVMQLPADRNSTYEIGTAAHTDTNKAYIKLTESGTSAKGTTNAVVTGDGVITVAGSANGVAIGHANKFATTLTNGTGSFGPSADVTKAASTAQASFVVPQVTVDQQGHVTGVTERTITLNDANTKYEWASANAAIATVTNGASATFGLKEQGSQSHVDTSFSAVSAGQSVEITAGNNGAINFEIVWGSFDS